MMAGRAGAAGLATAGAVFHWLEILREEKRTILLRAAAHAQRAVDFLHSVSRHEGSIVESADGAS